ncbi:MAG TPA: glutathione S-transferase [Rhizomicrobium sp.]|jgi:glutathione S-transferase
MKFYDSVGPNPQVVRMFAAEKGITLPSETVDLMKGENRQEAHLKRNPHGQMPCLELDNGQYLSEILPICEYLEDIHPKPALIGTTPEEKAETRMWTRRIDLNICEPMANGFRFSAGLPLFQSRIVTVPEAADGLKKIAQDRLKWLDGQMAGKQFICGNRFTLADVLLYCFVAFGNQVGQPLDPEFKNLAAWFAKVKDRPSANAKMAA